MLQHALCSVASVWPANLTEGTGVGAMLNMRKMAVGARKRSKKEIGWRGLPPKRLEMTIDIDAHQVGAISLSD